MIPHGKLTQKKNTPFGVRRHTTGTHVNGARDLNSRASSDVGSNPTRESKGALIYHDTWYVRRGGSIPLSCIEGSNPSEMKKVLGLTRTFDILRGFLPSALS